MEGKKVELLKDTNWLKKGWKGTIRKYLPSFDNREPLLCVEWDVPKNVTLLGHRLMDYAEVPLKDNRGWNVRLTDVKIIHKLIKIKDVKDIPDYNKQIARNGICAENKTEALKLLKKPRVETPEGIYLYGKKVKQ